MKSLLVSSQNNEVVSIGEDRYWTAMMFQGTTRKGFSCCNALPDDKLDSKIEKNGAEGASLFDTRVNWYWWGLAKRCDNFRCGAGVNITNHGDEVGGEAHVGEGGEQS